VLGDAVSWLATNHLLPLMSIIVEPAKVLFLNNAIGNGVLVPLGISQTLASGKSLLFLVESNPGPGVGILLAYMFSELVMPRHPRGRLHHCALRWHPRGLLPVRADEAAAHPCRHRRWYDGSGHQRGVWQWPARPASPGSIFAILLQTTKGSFTGVILSVVLSCAVSFAVASVMLRASRKGDLAAGETGDLLAAVAKTEANKGKSSSALGSLTAQGDASAADASTADTATAVMERPLRSIMFACDAGMGFQCHGRQRAA